MPVEIETPPAIDDVFVHDVPLPRRKTFFPLGFPLELATNSEAVMAAAEQSWGMFAASYTEAPLTLCLAVLDDDSDKLPPRPKFRSQLHLMSIVANARNHVICDLSRGCAYGWITSRMADEAAPLRLHFMEAPVMTLLVAAQLAPIHGALVTRNGVGVALCGESFAGKSTLSYACARSGWSLVSDDGTFLLRNRMDRYAVGNPYSVRFREDAKVLFPELEGCRVASRPNGKWGMEVRTAELPVETAGGCSIDHVVFLRRSRSGAARINCFDAAEALAWFERATLYGPPAVRAAQRSSYRRLLDAGIWELHYSNFSEAVELLNRLGGNA